MAKRTTKEQAYVEVAMRIERARVDGHAKAMMNAFQFWHLSLERVGVDPKKIEEADAYARAACGWCL